MRHILLYFALGFIVLASPFARADSYAGFDLYNTYNSDIRLYGGATLNDRISAHAEYIDAFDFILRGTLDYRISDHFYAVTGVSHYNAPLGSNTGGLLGIKLHTELYMFPTAFDVRYDSALDGFLSFGIATQYNFNAKFAVTIGYRRNTNDIKNEFALGLKASF